MRCSWSVSAIYKLCKQHLCGEQEGIIPTTQHATVSAVGQQTKKLTKNPVLQICKSASSQILNIPNIFDRLIINADNNYPPPPHQEGSELQRQHATQNMSKLFPINLTKSKLSIKLFDFRQYPPLMAMP